MARKEAKSRKRIIGLRSKTTKARTHVDRVREPRPELDKELEARTRELSEAREQQAATTEVLQVISSSPGKLEPVFETILANATRLCEAKFGNLFLLENDAFRAVAMHGPQVEWMQRQPVFKLRDHPRVPLARVAVNKEVLQIPDFRADQAYIERDPRIVAIVEAGTRSLLAVPMLKEGKLIGAIAIYTTEVRLFTEKQIDLVKNFASQAVIAIENARLLNELRQRTDDLSEALEQQTATSEVLQVISSSPGELEPVFETMLTNATRLCGAEFGILNLDDGDVSRIAAVYNVPPALAAAHNVPFRIHPKSGQAEIRRTKQAVHIDDIRVMPPYLEGDPRLVALADLGGARTTVAVPMLKEDALLGTITIYRQEIRPFTDRQIELVKNFAAQAVIAIENTRLLNKLRESLQQQTATADVLQVISSSPGELEPVFNKMLENATRICGAKFGVLFRPEGDAFRAVALHGAPPSFAEERQRNPLFRPAPRMALARAVASKQAVQIADVQAEPGYSPPGFSNPGIARLAGARTVLAAPMLREQELVGVIVIYRQEVRPFTDRQIELVKNFAKQAVIAIENTRLLNELRDSLQQQTATAEVLQVISSSPGDLEPVFKAMLENAVRICEAKFGNLLLYDGNTFRIAAMHGAPPAWDELRRRDPVIRVSPNNPISRVIATKQLQHIADFRKEQAYVERDPPAVALAEVAGARTVVIVPMLKENGLVGVIAIYRQEVRPFTDKQIALVQNFASQAVIAIENTRLLNELRQRTEDLSASLDQQMGMSEVLRVISNSPTDLAPVFDTILTNATRLCEGNFALLCRYDGGVLVGEATCHGTPEFTEKFMGSRITPGREGPTRLAALERRTVHVADMTVEPGFSPMVLQYERARTVLAVPLLRETNLVGVITIWRREVQPFTEQQIALVQTFADQAAIAIENTRLLTELRVSLQQQTATADVLKVISRSTFDLHGVLNTLVESAVRLCEADIGHIARPNEGGFLQTQAYFGMSTELKDELERTPFKPGRGSVISRALLERTTVQILDPQTDPEYKLSKAQRVGGYRTVIAAPLLREGAPIGVFGLGRYSVRPFTDKQMELLATFADQAVIAIENVRLFDEVQARTRDLSEALEQQTATSEVLRTISSAPGELEPVFETILERGTALRSQVRCYVAA